MGDSAWAGILMIGVAVLILAGFSAMWWRDRGRAKEVALDPERSRTDAHLASDLHRGSDGPRPSREEGRQ